MKTDSETLRLGDEEMVAQRGMPGDLFVDEVAVWKAPEEAAPREIGKPQRKAVVRREMTAEEELAVQCIRSQVTFPVGHWDKRFIRELLWTVTEKQAAQVWRIFKTYRRQITHERKAELLEMAERMGAPTLRRGDLEKRKGGEGKS